MAPSKKKLRSLADEIAELANPAPIIADRDPEAHDFGTEVGHFLDQDEEPEELGVHKTGNGDAGRLLLRGDITMGGGEYAGRKGSRKRTLEEEEGSEDEGEEEESDREGDEGHDDDSASDDMRGLEEERENDEDDDAPWPSMAQGEEVNALDEEYERLRQEEENMLKAVKSKGSADRQKGRAVANQRLLWDRMLELRIMLQKLLSSSHRLPQGGSRALFTAASAETAAAYTKVKHTALDTLSTLAELQAVVMQQNPAIVSSSVAAVVEATEEDVGEEPAGSKQSDVVDDCWQRIEGQLASLSEFRDASVDRWHRKTLLSSGAGAARGRLQALNQSVTVQVASAMREPARSLMIARTRLKREEVQSFGQAALVQQQSHSNNDNNNNNNKQQNVPNGAQEDGEESWLPTAAARGADADPETYDDSEFYQQLLREFLESAGERGGALAALGAHSLKKLRNKKGRKGVDRRASKGRKIRYTVQPQIVNFMAPEPINIPPIASKLFATLFGQRTRL